MGAGADRLAVSLAPRKSGRFEYDILHKSVKMGMRQSWRVGLDCKSSA